MNIYVKIWEQIKIFMMLVAVHICVCVYVHKYIYTTHEAVIPSFYTHRLERKLYDVS